MTITQNKRVTTTKIYLRGGRATNRRDGALFALLEAVAVQTMPGEERNILTINQYIFEDNSVKIISEKNAIVTYKMQ